MPKIKNKTPAAPTVPSISAQDVQEWGRGAWQDMLMFARKQLFGNLHGVEWTFNTTFSLIRRRWMVVAGALAFFITLCIALLLIVQPQYTAETLLQINTRQEQVTDMEDVLGGLSSSDAAIRTELDVLKSRKLALRVIRDQHILADENLGSGLFSTLIGLVKSAVLPVAEAPAKTAPSSKTTEATAREAAAVGAFLSRLEVSIKPRSYTISVRYTANNPETAARMVNGLAKAYLTNQMEERFDATKRANDWINSRLNQLQKNVQASDLAVRKFREENNLTVAGGVTLNDQQLSELNSQLILSRTQLAEAEAKVVATQRGVGTTSEVLNNPLIQNLRMQETEVRRKMSDLASRYGPMHPRMQTVRNELANVQSKIGEEMGKIRGSLDNDIDMARARVRTLEEQLELLQQRTQLSSGPAVQLAELERQANAERSLYEAFLARSRQIAQMDFVQADVRVISAAETPGAPSSPHKTMWLLMSILMGLGVGVGLMMLLELLDSGYRTSAQLEQQLGLPVLGLLGELKETDDVAHYVLNKPTGAFTEAVRAARAALQFAKPDMPPKVVLITSSVPQEGKSITAASMAQLAAASGQKVLLVDADMRRPSMAHKFNITAKIGLADVLVGNAKAKDAIQVMPKSGLHVLPTLANTHFAQELLGSAKMKDLIAEWRKTYDLVILDCPPVMAVADAAMLMKEMDAALFVVRWGTTPRPLVTHAIKQLKAANAPLAGVLLSRVDLDKQHAYGYGDYGYYYGKYKEYYNN